MEKCVVDLFNAVTQIHRRYYNAIGTRPDGTQYPQAIEASFSTELYHRFRTLMELPTNMEYYQNLILHYDINKEAIDIRPDIVLHEAQENRYQQKMFVEVKTDSRVNLENDYDKLLLAIDDYLHYDNAIIVIANRQYQAVKQQVSTHFEDCEFNKRLKLFLINAEIIDNNRIEYNLFQFSSISRNQ